MSITSLDGEPEAAVPAGTIGGAAEILALVSEMIGASPAASFQAARFLDGKGADPGTALAWLAGSARDLAAELDGALAAEGISIGRGLARHWKRPAAR